MYILHKQNEIFCVWNLKTEIKTEIQAWKFDTGLVQYLLNLPLFELSIRISIDWTQMFQKSSNDNNTLPQPYSHRSGKTEEVKRKVLGYRGLTFTTLFDSYDAVWWDATACSISSFSWTSVTACPFSLGSISPMTKHGAGWPALFSFFSVACSKNLNQNDLSILQSSTIIS